jgi:secondary thiamine-phosphate synthase enzyme
MEKLQISTTDQTVLINITPKIQEIIEKKNFKSGVCQIYVPHTTAAVTINENADPDVRHDIITELNKVIPFSDGYLHTEGNSAAHIKASMMGTSELVPVENGRLQLGTWQGIFFCEFDGPRRREIWIQFLK